MQAARHLCKISESGGNGEMPFNYENMNTCIMYGVHNSQCEAVYDCQQNAPRS